MNNSRLQQFANNHFQGFEAFSLSPEVEVLSKDEHFAFITGCAGSWLNAGISREIETLPDSSLLERFRSMVDERKLNSSWRIVSPSKDLPGGEQFWENLSWTVSANSHVMHLDIVSSPEPIGSSVRVVRALGETQVRDFAAIFSGAFGGDVRDVEFLTRFLLRFTIEQGVVPTQCYVGYMGDSPVGYIHFLALDRSIS